jgi:hypothetical protein
MATRVKEAVSSVERILLPCLNGIDGELRSISTRIDSVNTSLDSANSRIDEMDKRNAVQFDGFRTEIRGLSEKVDLVRDVERLQVEVADLKRRR